VGDSAAYSDLMILLLNFFDFIAMFSRRLPPRVRILVRTPS